jgi:hypothetical protein
VTDSRAALPGTPGAPAGRTPAIAGVSLLVANLLPLWALYTGRMSTGDVFIVYWLENVAVWLLTIVKVATASGTGGAVKLSRVTINGRPMDPHDSNGLLAGFFAFHYGIFTLVHGGFALGMAFGGGGTLHPRSWLLAGLLLLASHGISLGLHWFRGGECRRVSPGWAMVQPYPRMLVLHVAILAGFGLLLETDVGDGVRQLLPAVILVALKTVADLALHRWEHRRVAGRAVSPVAPG